MQTLWLTCKGTFLSSIQNRNDWAIYHSSCAKEELSVPIWQADERSESVAEFLGLLSAKKYGMAIHTVVSLVDEVAGNMLLPEQEQQLQLKPTKAFRKLSKLLKNEEVVRGILTVLLEGDDCLLMLDAICRVTRAPGFARQIRIHIASCSTAVETLQQLGSLLFRVALRNLSHSPTVSQKEASALQGCLLYMKTLMNLLGHSPEFAERAFRHEYLPLLTSFFPFPGAPPRAAEGARASLFAHLAAVTMGVFDHFVDTPQMVKNVLRSGAAAGLIPWLTRFFDLLTDQLKKFPARPPENREMRVTARSLLYQLNGLCDEAMKLSPGLLRGAEFDELHRSVQELKPLLDDSAKGNAEIFLGKVRNHIRKEKGTPPALEPSNLETVIQVLEAVRLAGANAPVDLLDEFVISLVMLVCDDFRKLLRKAPNVIPVLRDSFVAEVSRAAKKPRSSNPKAQERMRHVAMCLSSFLAVGASEGTLPVAVFDIAGAAIASILKPALSVLDPPGHIRILELLIFCFNYGGDAAATRREYARALAGVSFLYLAKPAASLAWHLTAAVFGARTWIDPEVVCAHEAQVGRQFGFNPRDREAVGHVSGLLPAGDVKRLVDQALRVLHEACLTPFTPEDRVQDVAEIVRRIVIECPEILELIVPRIGHVTRLLEVVCSSLTQEFGRHFLENPLSRQELVTPEEIRQWMGVFGPLVVVFKCAFDKCKYKRASREKLLMETAGNGGIVVCQGTLRDSRALLAGAAKSMNASGGSAAERAREMKERVGEILPQDEIAREIWAAYAEQFNLKECSNRACVAGVVEVRQKTFKACGACGGAQYCSRECQMVHWKNGHKTECKIARQGASSKGEKGKRVKNNR
ncbi:hypothetical protein KFL_000530100 [Klebsormidium nitens]|uniref:phytol kinase n=1 Tax=Klebsormidium nitens TaxID=105231 RepID=A0A1Y1HRF9_KLENI|nr:hypothetical protein KFL_000530100 [Klebsormidium nitens]|eukprot:GAQ80382.1 hypothetical protein KFL_000530100 [Klebsormidium nitens]